jgi:hypothetical protein
VSSKLVAEFKSSSAGPVIQVVIQLVAPYWLPTRLLMDADATHESVAIGGADKDPATRFEDPGQFSQAGGRIIHAFDDIVVGHPMNRIIGKKQFENGANLKTQFWPVPKFFAQLIGHIDSMNLRLLQSPNESGLISAPQPATRIRDSVAGKSGSS